MIDNSWWREAVFYHIYPRSFRDSNGDGVGDLRGIIEGLDYLEWLGVDAVWLSPFFPSPMVDFGYDISDFRNVDPIFGTLADFDALLEDAHGRGIRVIIDQVIHTASSSHPWFRESRSSRSNPKADWFIWRDPAPDGGAPNNWLSFFSGRETESAWEYAAERDQYYLRVFSREQCDLNLRNPAVQREMEQVLRFWLDRGVDGFRLDSVSALFKDESLRDFPRRSSIYEASSFSALAAYFVDQVLERPENLLAVEKIRSVMDDYTPERVAIGESASEKGIISYLDYSSPGRLNMAFNFQYLNAAALDPRAGQETVRETERIYDTRAWPCYVLGHHDGQRLLSRIDPEGRHDTDRLAKLYAAWLLTLRGTPFIYYGEELGLRNTEVPFDRLQDPFGINIWPQPGRDVCRTPLPWSDAPHAGFSSAEPWLPLGADAETRNIDAQREESDSVLAFYRELLRIRKASPALRSGRFEELVTAEDQLRFRRSLPEERITVCLNFSDAPLALEGLPQGEILLASAPLDATEGSPLLQAWGVLLLREA